MDSISSKASDTDSDKLTLKVDVFERADADTADALLYLSERIRAGSVLCSSVSTKVVTSKLSRVEISFFIHPENNEPKQ